jgi:hypothetical protein
MQFMVAPPPLVWQLPPRKRLVVSAPRKTKLGIPNRSRQDSQFLIMI